MINDYNYQKFINTIVAYLKRWPDETNKIYPTIAMGFHETFEILDHLEYDN